LQSKGYDVPNYPDSDATPADKEIRARYGKVLGQRRQSGAARGQFRPPRRRSREAVRAQTSCNKMGAWTKDSENARGAT